MNNRRRRRRKLSGLGAAVAATPRGARRAGRRGPHLTRERRSLRGRGREGCQRCAARHCALPTRAPSRRIARPASRPLAETASVRYLRAPVSGPERRARGEPDLHRLLVRARRSRTSRQCSERSVRPSITSGTESRPDREARDQTDDRRTRAGDVRSTCSRRGGRRLARNAPRGDGSSPPAHRS